LLFNSLQPQAFRHTTSADPLARRPFSATQLRRTRRLFGGGGPVVWRKACELTQAKACGYHITHNAFVAAGFSLRINASELTQAKACDYTIRVTNTDMNPLTSHP